MPNPVTIPHTEAFEIHSRHADADFEIWIATPVAGMVPFPPGPRRALYVLDANLFFGTAVEMTRLMSQLYGELPPLLVVGVGYHTSVPTVQAELRARDFTPTVDAGFGAMARSFPGAPEPTLPEGRRLGRAAEFLAFLTREAKPFVEERYDIAENGSVLFGSSLGGLFALHALLEQPDAFDAYIAVSPAIWWDDAALLKREAELAALRDDLNTTLFLAVGGNEERADIPALAPFKMVSNVHALAAQLAARDYPSLDLTSFVADSESHTSVVPVALTRGLRHVFRSLRPTRAPYPAPQPGSPNAPMRVE
jgi:predicted alpha/beta superfamily hydrolase